MPPVKKETAKKDTDKAAEKIVAEKKSTTTKTAAKRTMTQKNATAQDNLVRLFETTILIDFVEKQNGQWNHEEWITLCKIIAENYAPIDFDQVGLELEAKKYLFHSKR